MEYRPTAYEIEENPSLVRRVKVKMPNGGEAVMVYCQLLDKDGKLAANVTNNTDVAAGKKLKYEVK